MPWWSRSQDVLARRLAIPPTRHTLSPPTWTSVGPPAATSPRLAGQPDHGRCRRRGSSPCRPRPRRVQTGRGGTTMSNVVTQAPTVTSAGVERGSWTGCLPILAATPSRSPRPVWIVPSPRLLPSVAIARRGGSGSSASTSSASTPGEPWPSTPDLRSLRASAPDRLAALRSRPPCRRSAIGGTDPNTLPPYSRPLHWPRSLALRSLRSRAGRSRPPPCPAVEAHAPLHSRVAWAGPPAAGKRGRWETALRQRMVSLCGHCSLPVISAAGTAYRAKHRGCGAMPSKSN
jgi:hypothetical protein